MSSLRSLKEHIASCRECEAQLPLGPRPVIQVGARARVLIIGQAPGRRVHETGIPWNDPSGKRLRSWLGVSEETFYDARRFAIVPMGFCYPGSGPSGDLPPRPECAPLWHAPILKRLRCVELTLLLSRYAQAAYLQRRGRRGRRAKNLTEAVRGYEDDPTCIALPHPSPRNNRWFKSNPWFDEEVVPFLRRRVDEIFG